MTVPKRTDEVVLFQNDDQHEINRLRLAIETAATSSKTPLRLGDDDDVVVAAEAYDAYVAVAAERGTRVTVENMPGRKWREHVAANPPRDKNEDDAEWGFNYPALGEIVVPLCVTAIDGQPATEDDIDNLNDGDFSRIYAAVLKVNTGRGPDPTVSISGTLRRTLPETSESPARLG